MTQQAVQKLASMRELESSMYPFVLPSLPFSEDALEPYMSKRTFEFHYHRHHMAYVSNLNSLLEQSELKSLNLERIIIESSKNPANQPIFNNAAQVWNHAFFWNSMSAPSATKPRMSSEAQLALKDVALKQFGSGWAWLVYDSIDKSVKTLSTSNAQTPLTDRSKIALLCCDVWEHAYYIQYQNKRADFVQDFLAHLVDWEFAEENLRLAKARS